MKEVEQQTGGPGASRTGDTHAGFLPVSPHVERDDDSPLGGTAVLLWNPGAIDQRLNELTNRRWLAPWRRMGDDDLHPPLITEVDATGVDRRDIARLVSPDQLRAIERQTFRERAVLMSRRERDHSVRVLSFQHLLLQALQEAVLRNSSGTATTPGGAPAVGTPSWQEGDLVSYCREIYTVTHVGPRVIRLESAQNGSVDVYRSSDQMRQLRRLAPALRTASPGAP